MIATFLIVCPAINISAEKVYKEILEMPVTLKEASEYLEIAEINLRKLIKAGKLKHKIVGRNFVFDPDDLIALKECKN